MNRNKIAEELLGSIEWVNESKGFLECPAKDFHATESEKEDCCIRLEGVPTISCTHVGCEPFIQDFNVRLRRAISNFDEYVKEEPTSKEKDRLDPMVAFQSFSELEVEYKDHLKRSKECQFNLGSWLPTLGEKLRPLVPGEMAVILADTGVGKTFILQNLAMVASPLQTLLFEIELPSSLMFERFASLQNKVSGRDIESHYNKGGTFEPCEALKKIHVCPYSRIDVHDIKTLIDKSEKKIGCKPALVLVDYIGLIGAKGNSRYERMSYIAEQLKITAKETNTIVITSCQIHRKSEDAATEVSLHDAKDSGSIENSAGLVMGCWREGGRGEYLKVKVLKSTKGGGNTIVNARFNGSTGLIYE